MRRFTLLFTAALATLGAGSSAFAAHRSHVRVGVVVGHPYYYGPYYGPSFYDPYPYYRPSLYGFYRPSYETSGVRLKVHPNEARVLVDGYYAGTVDDFDGAFQQLDLKPGRHEITVKLAGYRTHSFRVYAAPGRTLKLSHELEKGTGADETEDLAGR